MSNWKQLLVSGLLLAGMSGAATTESQAAPAFVTPKTAPASWTRYAAALRTAIKAALEQDEHLQRLYAESVNGTASDQTLALRVWVTPRGAISRVALDDTNTLLLGKRVFDDVRNLHLQSKPPKGILMPIHLQLHLSPPAQLQPK
jgi:hypothetical protein